MKRLQFYLLSLAILFPLLSTSDELQRLNLAVGQRKSFKLGSRDRAWIEKPKFFKIEERESELVLQGALPGESLVQIAGQSFRINILPAQQLTAVHGFESAINDMMGLKATFEGDEVVIGGELLRIDDWIKLVKVAKNHGLKLKWKAQVDEAIQDKVKKYFQESFKAAALPSPLVKFDPELALVISSQQKEKENETETESLDRAKDFAASFGLKLQTSDLHLTLAPMVRVKITLAEIKRDQLTRYGIKWPESLAASASGAQSATIKVSDIDLTLNALSQQGSGRVLASPALLCRSGKEAEFLAGGEIPIKVSGYKTQGVIWKRYGVLLKVSPQADASGQMSIAITTEVSSIDPGNTVDGVPGFFTNRVQTHFDLKESETIVISGLIRHMDGETSEGLPGLAKLPYIGSLFSSKEFRSQNSELVAFVTPEIVE